MKYNNFILMENRIQKAIKKTKKKTYVSYSAYETDKNDEPIDNLDKVAVNGKVILIQRDSDYWGDEKSKVYESKILENPTWLEVAICANDMIHTVRDFHHVFLEALSFYRKEGEVSVYKFDMGS